MDTNSLKSIIKSNKWTNQAMDMTPLNCDPGIFGLTAVAQREIGEGFGTICIYYKKGECEIYYPQNRTDRLGKLYLKQKDKIDSLYSDWLKIVKKIETEFYKVKAANLAKLSGKELLRWYSKIYDILSFGWALGAFVEVYDNTSEKIISDSLKKENAENKLTESEKHDLFSPATLTVVQEERLSFVKILDYIKKNYKQIRKRIVEKDKKLAGLLKNHAENFFFIHANYDSADEFTQEEVLEKIIKEINEADIAKELREFSVREKEYRVIPKRREKTIKKYELSKELQELSHFFFLIIKWRDQRKKMHQMGVVTLEKMVREAAKRKKIPQNLVRYMIFQDFQQGFSNLNKMLPVLKKRAKESFMVLEENGKFSWLFGKDAKAAKKEVDDTIFSQKSQVVKGTSACKGKITGVVKIVKSREAFKKFNKGDILVASMTRVEFMPVVRKSSAIITDEGGITCHAAIVSRELSIPCIIGTKIATKVLKDGDLVEVNADKGIIRVIK